MMADFRALCAELLDWAEVTAAHYIQLPAVMLRARAALADEPAVPDGREPASVTKQPSDEEIIAFWSDHCAGDGDAGIIRLARWDHQPAPPADGEVAELVADLRQQANHGYCEFISRDDLLRAADLLQRLSPPQPVPVSERPPGPKDCDAEHYCWRWNTIGGLWARQPLTRSWYEFESHWLPAHALPLPEVGK